MKRYERQNGVLSRACSKCGDDLGDRYGVGRYCKKCHAGWMRKNRKSYKDLTDEQRQKVIARAYANVAIKRGKMKKQACLDCASAHSEMHHEDYSKPLEVIWLCRKCHLKRHENSIDLLRLGGLGAA